MEALQHAFVYLVAAVIAVPLAKKLGLGSVLGYLLAGIFIGPALGIVGDETEAIKHFAEFGVVMMLFLVGLELRPSMLWNMRNQLLGLGGLQIGGTTLMIFLAALAFGLPWKGSLALGMILALSSTAIVLQSFSEKGWLKLPGGQSAFSVLLTQDIAVIPMLALLPLLATGHGDHHHNDHGHSMNLLESYPGWLQAIVILFVIVAIIAVGRFVMRPIFRFIAESKLREIFTAAALLLVISVALLMTFIGLSPALGTFLAGVVLSDSEYRHELESDIEPFKGLLLGLFFISVGAGMDFGLFFSNPLLILGLALGIMAVKWIVLMIAAKVFKLSSNEGWMFSLGLSQAGEFAFVLIALAVSSYVLPAAIAKTLILVVAVTMLLTPLLFIIYERFISPRASGESTREADKIEDRGTAVVAGVGRFGLVVTRMLTTNGNKVVVLDHDADFIEILRKLGVKTHYGDATRPDLLHATGLDEAKLFVASLDDREKQNQIVEHVAKHYPNCRIIARAVDRIHIYELEKAGAHIIEHEVFESSLSAGKKALIELGTHPFRAELQSRIFRNHDREGIADLRELWENEGVGKNFLNAARVRNDELNEIMKFDRATEKHDASVRGWSPPPKGDADA